VAIFNDFACTRRYFCCKWRRCHIGHARHFKGLKRGEKSGEIFGNAFFFVLIHFKQVVKVFWPVWSNFKILYTRKKLQKKHVFLLIFKVNNYLPKKHLCIILKTNGNWFPLTQCDWESIIAGINLKNINNMVHGSSEEHFSKLHNSPWHSNTAWIKKW